ncbi:hypothetical protein BDR22DRAFT_852580 [Usnea florida]
MNHPTLVYLNTSHPPNTKYISSWCTYAISLLSSAMKMHDEPDRPPSRLLLLPSEIRTLILEKLIPRDRCARGYTRVDLPPSKSELWRRKQAKKNFPVSYLQTCRRLYEEGSHFYYSTSVFHFEKDYELGHFVHRRSFAQLCAIQHLQFDVPDRVVSFDSWDEISWGLNFMAFDVVEVLHTTRKLRNLQSLDLLVGIPFSPKYMTEFGYFTHFIHPVLEEFVKELAVVTVDAKAPNIENLDPDVLKFKHYGPHSSSDEFASFVWARLNLEAAQEAHKGFVLKECHISSRRGVA